jgi:hypothetical protein
MTSEALRKFLETARERYDAARAADEEDRAEAIADNTFAQGGEAQWDADDIAARVDAGRPVLTWNRLHVFSAQVINDGRQSKPAIKVAAMDGGTKATAEFFQSRIRHIEYESDADIAYDTARDQQVISGRGFIRVNTRFLPGTFQQEIRIERIEDQFTVVCDHSAHLYDRSDAEFWFIVTTFSKEAYERKFGKDTEVSRSDFFKTDNPAPAWIGVGESGEEIQVAEYWHKKHKIRVLCEIHGGKSLYEDELPPGLPESAITNRRDEDTVTVVQSIINGVEILEETEWLIDTIPIFPLWGRESFVKGKRRTASLIRNSKHPQKLVNLYVSNIAEQIAQMPKTPYLAAEGQITNHEEAWENINTSPKAVVLYKPRALDGTVVGAPQRIQNEPPIQALTLGLNQAIDAIKASMGIFDASLGGQARETSGIAIQKRQKESDNANFHFHDNEARTRRAIGRTLLQLIPLVDKGERTVPTRSVDGKTKLVKINAPSTDVDTGEPIHHDLTQGSYGCSIATGQSYTSQRQEAFDIYSQLATADKNFMSVAGDVLFRAMDAPGSDELADRYEKLLPPPLQPQKAGGQQQQQQMQQQMAMLTQQHAQLVQVVHKQAQELETRSAEQQNKLEIAKLQEETKRVIALATLSQKDGLSVLAQEVNILKEQFGQQQAAASQQSAQQHAATLQAAQQQHEQQMQQDSQAHQAGMQQDQNQADSDAAQQQQDAQEQQPKAA